AVGVVAVDDLDASVRALTVGGYDPYRDPAGDNPLAETRTVAPTGTRSADAPAIDAKDIARVLGWDAPRLDPAGLLASGEAIPVRCSHSAALAHERGFDAMFDATREVIAAADVAVVPWEPALNEGDVTPCERSFHLVASPATAAAAADAGFDVALAAGNHVGDCVETAEACDQGAAVLATLEHLRAAGLLVAGAGADLDEARAPAVLTADGVTFAFLAYDDIAREFLGATADLPGTAPLDLATLAVDVAAAKARADHVVVGFSWGVEYTSAPTARQREAAGVAVAAGASLVVGNHPHWVQATERIGDAFVAYGLGNFVFDQDGFEERTQGAVLEAGFTRERLLGVRLRPTAIRERHRPEFVVPHSGESRAILGRIWDATDALPPRESLPEAKD
ncbi:MAG: CapA family protein, partial [Dehalococcoidia bacterium]